MANFSLTSKLPSRFSSRDRLIKRVSLMGHLYDLEIDGSDEFSKFQEVLDNFDSDNVTGMYDTLKKLKFLAPKCSDVIVKCKWGGQERNCIEIIHTRRTNQGFCCTFNYVRPSNDEFNYELEPKVAAGIGPDMGLTLLMNLSSSDYFYPLKNLVGATAIIFDPFEFPDSTIGGVSEVPLEMFVETRITLNAITKKAVEEVQRYSIEKRECLFKTELAREYEGNYIYGDCLVREKN